MIVIDTEHGPGGSFELEHHLRAAEAVDLPALVRVPAADSGVILAALDSGAAGVVVPHVLDKAGSEAVVAAAHYPPRGSRGFATSTRAAGYSALAIREHLRRAARETCVVVQIEDAEAVPRSSEILEVPDLSGLLIGATDLSISLGHPGDQSHPEVEAAVAEVMAAAARAHVPVLAVASSKLDAARWRARGAAVVLSIATVLIRSAFVAAVHDTSSE
jgi:4-hydroxy-2-oxoheptanedioate aldolase